MFRYMVHVMSYLRCCLLPMRCVILDFTIVCLCNSIIKWFIIHHRFLSESHHSHYSLHQRHSPDPNPQNSNHRHLSALINSTISLHSSLTLTVWSQTFHAWLTWPPLPFVYLPASILTICSSFSTTPALHRTPRKKKGHWHTDKTQETFPFPACLPGYSAHLTPHCRCSINLMFVLHLYLCALCLSADNFKDLEINYRFKSCSPPSWCDCMSCCLLNICNTFLWSIQGEEEKKAMIKIRMENNWKNRSRGCHDENKTDINGYESTGYFSIYVWKQLLFLHFQVLF